jgi:hypothetical protein
MIIFLPLAGMVAYAWLASWGYLAAVILVLMLLFAFAG